MEVHLDRVAILKMMARPSSLTLGECYMDGSIRFVQGGVFDFVAMVARNAKFGVIKETWLKRILQGLRQHNDGKAARRNAAHHYDLSVDLYRRFLDADLQYSCAWFARPDMTLDEAQAAKRDRIARKLLLRPGDRVLDIGCGWGGLGIELASREQVQVLGVTLAVEQQAAARARAKARGWTTASPLNCATIASRTASSSASSPSACWSTWGGPTSTPISRRWRPCSARTVSP